MSFIAKHFASRDERLVYIIRPHWIYLAEGIFWFLFLTMFGFLCDIAVWHVLDYISPRKDFAVLFPFIFSLEDDFAIYIGAFIGLMIGIIMFCRYYGTEIAITDHRVIYKTGLFFVTVEEVDISEITEEKVNHGLIGHLLGFGDVKLDSRFVGDVQLPAIKNPHRFLRYTHKVRAGLRQDQVEKDIAPV